MVAMLVAIADREVQRILLELLNQMDGFDQNVNVKVMMMLSLLCPLRTAQLLSSIDWARKIHKLRC